jgi:hypothetical protein
MSEQNNNQGQGQSQSSSKPQLPEIKAPKIIHIVENEREAEPILKNAPLRSRSWRDDVKLLLKFRLRAMHLGDSLNASSWSISFVIENFEPVFIIEIEGLEDVKRKRANAVIDYMLRNTSELKADDYRYQPFGARLLQNQIAPESVDYLGYYPSADHKPLQTVRGRVVRFFSIVYNIIQNPGSIMDFNRFLVEPGQSGFNN